MATKTKATKQDRAITTTCPKCGDVKTVRGLTWHDLQVAGIDVSNAPETLERKCSGCAYREGYKSKPLTDEQKAKRREYQKKRREQIQAALALAKAQQALEPQASQNGEVTDDSAQ